MVGISIGSAAGGCQSLGHGFCVLILMDSHVHGLTRNLLAQRRTGMHVQEGIAGTWERE